MNSRSGPFQAELPFSSVVSPAVAFYRLEIAGDDEILVIPLNSIQAAGETVFIFFFIAEFIRGKEKWETLDGRSALIMNKRVLPCDFLA